jgi:hypothetical protein
MRATKGDAMQTNVEPQADSPICSMCSCQNVGPGRIVIHDKRKWLVSSIPCPVCMEEWRMGLEAMGRRMTERRNRAVLDVLLSR